MRFSACRTRKALPVQPPPQHMTRSNKHPPKLPPDQKALVSPFVKPRHPAGQCACVSCSWVVALVLLVVGIYLLAVQAAPTGAPLYNAAVALTVLGALMFFFGCAMGDDEVYGNLHG